MRQNGGLKVQDSPERPRIRTLVIDSDPGMVLQLQNLVLRDPEVEFIGYCGNGSDALSMIRATAPDLIFLDIQIPGMDGFSLLEHLQGEKTPVVIFVTGDDHYALQAFEFSALDYLLKPLTPDRVTQALKKAKVQIRAEDKMGGADHLSSRLAIRSGKKVFFLQPQEIDWIEAEGNSVRLHSGAESHVVKMSISILESELDPDTFVRIHRSTIVNVDRIRWLEPSIRGNYRVTLHDGTQLVMSRKDRLADMTGKAIRKQEG